LLNIFTYVIYEMETSTKGTKPMSKIDSIFMINAANKLPEPHRTSELNQLFQAFFELKDWQHCIKVAKLVQRNFTPEEVESMIG